MAADKKSAVKKTKPPIYEERWFETAVLLGCLALTWLLWQGLDTASPIAQFRALPDASVRLLLSARQLAEGQYLQIFSEAGLPPVYPAVLAGIARLSDTNLSGQSGLMNLLSLAKALNFYAYLAMIVLVNQFVRSRVQRPVSFLLTGLVCVSPLLVGNSFLISPTILYMLFAFAALVLADRSFEKAEEPGHAAKALWAFQGLALTAALLTLPVGYTLLLAFLMAGTRKLGLKRALIPMAVVLLLGSPFVLRDIYYSYEPGIRSQGWQSVIPSVQSQAHTPQIQSIAKDATHGMLGELSWGENRLPLTSLPWLRWSVLSLIGLGMAYGLWQRSGIGSVYILCFALHACFLERSVHPHTFAPLLPLLMMYLYLGLLRVGEWLQHIHIPLTRVSVPALSAMFALSAVTTYVNASDFMELPDAPHKLLAQLSQSAELGIEPIAMLATATPLPTSGSTTPAPKLAQMPEQELATAQTPMLGFARPASQTAPATPQTQTTAPKAPASDANNIQRWLSLNAPSTALVGHADENLLPNTSQPRALQSLLRMDYIIEESTTPGVTQRLNQVMQQARARFQLVYNDPTSGSRIWQVLR